MVIARLRLVAACAAMLATGALPLSRLAAQQLPSSLPVQIPDDQMGSPQNPGQGTQNPLLDPDFVAQLQNRIEMSGLTPDQIHERLDAEGYPDDLLDPYLPGSTMSPGAITPPDSETTAEVFEAMTHIGLIDSTTIDSLRGMRGLDTLTMTNRGARSNSSQSNQLFGPDTIPLDDSLARMQAWRQGVPRRMLDTSAAAWDTSEAGGGSFAARRRAQQLRLLRPRGDTTLPIFGLSLFERTSTQFRPNLTGPVDDTYRLEPGDQLQLVITGDVEMARSLVVSRDGFIVIPQTGQLYVANMSLGQLTDVLYDRLGRVYSGIRRGSGATTHFSLNVGRLHANLIFVVGDVVAPGSYQISSAGTAMSALYASLGPSINGSLRHIEIRRNGKTVDSLDVYNYLLRGDASHDIRLQNGDIVFVPVHGPRVEVTGEIIRPAIYELKPGETLHDAIDAAGGFAAAASRRRIQITRVLPPDQRGPDGHDRSVIDVAAEDVTSGPGLAIPLVAGDSIAVFPVAAQVRNRIVVRGDVWSPGAQGFTVGERLSDAIKLSGGVRPDAYLGEVLVTRVGPDSARTQLRTSLRDSTGVPTADLPLQEYDEIQVFALREIRARRYVAIAGAVHHGGRYIYRDGMTLRDLVLLAGGLLESADLREAEIAQMPENRAGGVTAVTTRVPLDSSYIAERELDSARLRPPGVPPTTAHAPEVPLRPYDNVLILRQPDWSLPRSVAIAGEVRAPGRYTLTTKSERLRDVVERAGGLTPEAFVDGITLIRRQGGVGRIGVSLSRVMHDANDRDNLILQDNDSLYIPFYSGIVRVRGWVNAATAVAYVPGKNIDYYIRAAGGASGRGDDGNAYVTQPNGKIQSKSHTMVVFKNYPDPAPGSTVYVPLRYDAPYNPARTAIYTLIAQVVGSIATIIAISRP